MRGRAVGSVLIGLGAFALVASLSVWLVLVPNVVKLPLDPAPEGAVDGLELTADGTGMTFVDPETFELREGQTGRVDQLVKGDVDSEDAGDDVAVWHFGSIGRDAEGRDIGVVSGYRVCLDRRTAESIPDCPSARVNDKADVDINGLTLTFPFGTEKRDYELFNATAEASFPATFAGEEEIDGLSVYRFEQTIPETVIREVEVPGELAGAPGEFAVLAQYVYTNQRTLWVEPTSGVIVSAEERPNVVLRGPDGTNGITGFEATFTATEQTRTEAVARAQETRDKINLVGTTIPLGLLAVGLLLLLVGALLWRRAATADARRRHEAPEEQPRQAAEVH